MSKPKVSYAEFAAQMKLKEHTVAYAIQWRLSESKKPGARKLGESLAHYTLQPASARADRREDDPRTDATRPDRPLPRPHRWQKVYCLQTVNGDITCPA
jgi:hypothetical protein